MEQLQTPTIGVTINKKSTTTEPPPYELRFVFMLGGDIHSRTCDTVQCFYEEKWTVGNYLPFTLHLQVEKQRFSLHTTL